MGPLTLVKLGGSLLENDVLRSAALDAIATQWKAGERLVVVHGGGKHIDAELSRRGIGRHIAGGLRVTDEATLDVVVSVLAGKVNKLLLSELTGLGVDAVGLSGADGSIVVAKQHPPVDGQDLGHVGLVVESCPDALLAMIDAGFLPVVASLGATGTGDLLNVNADSAAAAIAVSIDATQLVFLTDVEGYLSSKGEVVAQLAAPLVEDLIGNGQVGGGMRPKLEACLVALRGGVKDVMIAGPSRHATCLYDGIGGTHLVAA